MIIKFFHMKKIILILTVALLPFFGFSGGSAFSTSKGSDRVNLHQKSSTTSFSFREIGKKINSYSREFIKISKKMTGFITTWTNKIFSFRWLTEENYLNRGTEGFTTLVRSGFASFAEDNLQMIPLYLKK
jgi:hypothetical protein